MKIDFRQPCYWCGDNSRKILACDATKIGIGFKSTFVKPIETPEIHDSVVRTPNRRLDRCFITNATSNSAVFNNARKRLKEICTVISSKSDFNELVLNEEMLQSSQVLHDSYLPPESRSAFIFMTRKTIHAYRAKTCLC